jgi:hypothetical protein
VRSMSAVDTSSPLFEAREDHVDIPALLFCVSQAHPRVSFILSVLLEGIGIEWFLNQACILVSILQNVTGVSFYAKNGGSIPLIMVSDSLPSCGYVRRKWQMHLGCGAHASPCPLRLRGMAALILRGFSAAHLML